MDIFNAIKYLGANPKIHVVESSFGVRYKFNVKAGEGFLYHNPICMEKDKWLPSVLSVEGLMGMDFKIAELTTEERNSCQDLN